MKENEEQDEGEQLIIEQIIEEEEEILENSEEQSINEGSFHRVYRHGVLDDPSENNNNNEHQVSLKELVLEKKASSKIQQQVLEEKVQYEGDKRISIQKVRKVSTDNPNLEQIVLIKKVSSQRKTSEKQEPTPVQEKKPTTVVASGKAAGETVERQESGAVPFKIYKDYTFLAGNAILIIIVICFIFT